jgi:hypothetical protein
MQQSWEQQHKRNLAFSLFLGMQRSTYCFVSTCLSATCLQDAYRESQADAAAGGVLLS